MSRRGEEGSETHTRGTQQRADEQRRHRRTGDEKENSRSHPHFIDSSSSSSSLCVSRVLSKKRATVPSLLYLKYHHDASIPLAPLLLLSFTLTLAHATCRSTLPLPLRHIPSPISHCTVITSFHSHSNRCSYICHLSSHTLSTQFAARSSSVETRGEARSLPLRHTTQPSVQTIGITEYYSEHGDDILPSLLFTTLILRVSSDAVCGGRHLPRSKGGRE